MDKQLFSILTTASVITVLAALVSFTFVIQSPSMVLITGGVVISHTMLCMSLISKKRLVVLNPYNSFMQVKGEELMFVYGAHDPSAALLKDICELIKENSDYEKESTS